MTQEISTGGWLNPRIMGPNITAMKTSAVIKARLRELGKTQGWLAEEVGVSVNAVSKWTREGKVSRDKVPVVAKVLGITTDQLLGASLVDVTPPEDSTLERLSPEEKRLLNLYRESTKDGKMMIYGAATVAPKDESLLIRRPN
jgi:transcriptional regulator with XRE-family HTH domain